MASKASAVAATAAAGVAGVASFAYLSFTRPLKSADAPPESQKTMKKLFLVKPNKDVTKAELAVNEVPIPTPKKGQVLVKMVAAAVNPSDYVIWLRGSEKEPTPIGLEGSGIVVASGGGMSANRLVGKAVAVTSREDGTYGEYLCVDAMGGAFVIDDSIKPEDAASISTSDDEWEQQLTALIEELEIKVAFDAIAGDMSGTLLSLLPSNGTCFVYGGLSKQPVSSVNPIDLIYKKKKLEGHFLASWIYSGGTLATIRRMGKANKLVNEGLAEDGWAVTSFVDCSMDDMFANFVEMWEKEGFTGKKLRIRMDV